MLPLGMNNLSPISKKKTHSFLSHMENGCVGGEAYFLGEVFFGGGHPFLTAELKSSNDGKTLFLKSFLGLRRSRPGCGLFVAWHV